MADLTELQSSQPVKVAGAGPTTGVETYFMEVTRDGAVKVVEQTFATFIVNATSVVPASNKSMVSLLNAGGSAVKVRIRDLKIINSQVTGVTGVTANFDLFRFTGHSAGTSITPLAYDTSDSLNGSVTSRTGATITGETSLLRRWVWSTDEWGTGPMDVESTDHTFQNFFPAYAPDRFTKPITLNAGEGIHIKFTTASTVGGWDFWITFTQEDV